MPAVLSETPATVHKRKKSRGAAVAAPESPVPAPSSAPSLQSATLSIDEKQKRRKRKSASAFEDPPTVTKEVEAEVGAAGAEPRRKRKKAQPAVVTDVAEPSEPALEEAPAQPVEVVEKPKKRKKPLAGIEPTESTQTKKRVEQPPTVISPVSEPTVSKSPAVTPETKKKSKKSKPQPVVEPPSERDVVDSGGDDEDDVLHGFSTDADSSDDDGEEFEEWGGLDVEKLPTIAKDDAVVKKKLEKAKRKPTEDRGVIYLGRIPHGFFEDQMKAYFSQFGTVTRLRLSRNKRTGRSKHYAFIEFDSSSVAQIVAETMDNYLLMGHILTCKVIPKDEVHPELWIGANRKWRAVPRDRIARVQHNKPRTEEEQRKAENRLLKRQAERKRKLEEAGIKYDFKAVAYKKAKPIEA